MRMTETGVKRCYDLWSRVYDAVFAPLVLTRQRRALQLLKTKPGDRILDLGVGTGVTLSMYNRDVTVIGADLSAGMLAKAAEKCRHQSLAHCHLIQADALLPPLAESSFDYVVMTHTISVVSDPHRVLNWATRLIKPTGRIILLNHFQSPQPVMAWLEKFFNPLFMRMGWRSDLTVEELLNGANLHVEYCFKMRLLDLWQIAVLSLRPRSQPHRTPPPNNPASIHHAPLAFDGAR